MPFKPSIIRSTSDQKLELAFSNWIDQQLASTQGQAFVVTFTFSKTKHCQSLNGGLASASERKDGRFVTIQKPEVQRMLVREVESWYFSFLRRLFGKRYNKYRALHPRLFGHIDDSCDQRGSRTKISVENLSKPQGLNRANGSPIRLKSGDSFLHVRAVLIVPHPLLAKFNQCVRRGWIPQRSLRLDPDFRTHIVPVHHTAGALSYAQKFQRSQWLDFSPDVVLPA